MNIAALKAATVLVKAPGSLGTAYLISPTRFATCHHVVENVGEGGAVTLIIGAEEVRAIVSALSVETDCALLDIERPVLGMKPLPLVRASQEKAIWDGFGFPNLAARGGVPFFGKVLDPESNDDIGRPMVTLYSDMVAAGMAAPINGLSGGPVAVEGAVIGHFSRVLGTPGAPGQPALGVVYAARSSNVLALAGLTAASAEPELPAALPLGAVLPALGEGEFHAFISYRATDRPFAMRLYERMDAIGLRVFIDQRELVPGDRLASTQHSPLDRSRAGVVLVSRGWLESPWCREECERLVHRAVSTPGFRLVPLRLEDVAMPGPLSTRLWLDFAGQVLPSGDKLNQAVYAVLGRPPPLPGSAENKLHTVDTASTDEALRRVDQMVVDRIRNPLRFRGIVEYLKQVPLPASAAKLRAAEALIGAGWLASALEILPPADESLRARQLRALALSKDQKDQQALDLLEPLVADAGEPIDAETAGILGGVYKRMWARNGQPIRLAQSLETYAVAYQRSGAPYLGVNVATLALLSGETSKAERVAREVVAKLGARSEAELDAWDRATLGEAYSCLGERDEGLRWYRRAAVRAARRPQDVAVMRRQARLIYAHRAWDGAPLSSALPTPRVVGFSGHMTDLPGRATPRFPPSRVEPVRRRIAAWLRERGAQIHGVSSAARGGDLLFLGEVLASDGTATVLLPFPRSEFIETSIGHDKGWQTRFESVTADERVYCATPLLEQAPPAGPEQAAAFERCNEAIAQEAERLADLFDDPKPTLLTLWNGEPGDGSGGTAHAIGSWQQRGFPHVNIDIRTL
jgi:hypothetical protein